MAKMNVVFFQCCLVVASLLAYGEAKKDIGTYVLKKGDFTLNFTNYGATMLSAIVPDKNGKLADVALGYDTFEQYKKGKVFFGGLIGRVANRIGKAEFTLNGVKHKLSKNDGNNTLHGGNEGFSHAIWDVHSYDEDHVTFTYDSYDHEEGFPGAVSVYVTYIIMDKNRLAVKMEAKPLTKPTPINLALHTYWNLGGHNSGDILSHDIQLFGSKITPVDDEFIPTGEILDIRGSPYDFLQPRKIGSRINELPNGYDVNYALDGTEGRHLRKVAMVRDSKSGRKMELWSNQVGVQFYTSGMIKDEPGKGGFVYKKHAGLCLETQGFPDSVNHPNFPSQIVNPGQTYKNVMLFRFTAA